MKTAIINIYGAPGSGKSTLAAELYTYMKQNGESVELVRECIKKWAWQGHKPSVFEQIYITNQQMLEESSLYGKVNFLITDSPLALGSFYCNYYHSSNLLDYLANNIYKIAKEKLLVSNVINLYVPIDETIYNSEGRYSSLEEALFIDKMLQKQIPNEIKILDGLASNRLINSIEYVKIKYNN